MEAHNHFTCIAYSSVDFLVQSQYVVSGVYLHVPKNARNVVFNRETLPHIYIGDLLEREFLCQPLETYSVVLIMKQQDFVSDVCVKIADYTDTAFPASGNFALSVNGAISSKIIDVGSLRLMPSSIRGRMEECGICAVGFPGMTHKQLLLSPDMLLRKFFAIGLLKKER